MYIAIDVGGTKTIVACLDDSGVILEHTKIYTPYDYQDFLAEITKILSGFSNHDFKAGAVGVPAVDIDRQAQKALRFSNLPWRNVYVAKDIEKIAGCPMFMENDAKLGALSETMLVGDEFKKILYLTIGTGIGYAVINDLKIDSSAGDGGGRMILVNRDNRLVPWETIVSGHAIVERYGKMAKDIKDQKTWKTISHDLAEGLEELIAIFQPEVIIIGGSVGNYFDKYAELLKKDIASYHLPFVNLPDLRGAKRADHAVVYGCYDYAKQMLKND